MAVMAIKEYVGDARDTMEHYEGKQIVYVNWHQHLLFAAPFLICIEPEASFGDLVTGPLAQLISPDPDAAAVDWDTVIWTKEGEPFAPDFAASIAANGIGHKDGIWFETPGLNTVCGG